MLATRVMAQFGVFVVWRLKINKLVRVHLEQMITNTMSLTQSIFNLRGKCQTTQLILDAKLQSCKTGLLP